MKAFPLRLIAISISIICILNVGLVSALNSGDISVSPKWATEVHYQGETATVQLILTSNSSEQLTIYYAGIHFDWMPADKFIGLDLSSNPVVVAGYGVQVFDPMAIQISANVSAGSHTYSIGIDGTEGPSSIAFSWDSPVMSIQIIDSNSKVFNDLLPQVANNLSRAINATYQGSEAQSLLEQAKTEYSQSIMSASQENWSEALASLQNASSYLTQAAAAEQRYIEQNAQQQMLLIYLAIAAVAIIVAVSVIAVMVRRRRRRADFAVDESVVDESMADESVYDDSVDDQPPET
jgi:hypothetical protein